jgi:peptidoglycan hydrolase-like protein with peptidoglycan-binding domain
VKTLPALLIIGVLAIASPLAKSPKRGAVRASKRAPAKPAPAFDSVAVNDPQAREDVHPGSAGSAVVRAQILLDRAHFSPGEIDGRWGDNLRVAIVGYQAARKLNPSSIIDSDTWQSLNADSEEVLVSYPISVNDIAGPFNRVPRDIMAQAKLKRLGYESPLEALGEKFHINPALLAQLNPGKNFTQSGNAVLVPNVRREHAVPADKVTVSKNSQTVSAFLDDGTLLAQYPATIGSEHDPLPIGDWKITEIGHNP